MSTNPLKLGSAVTRLISKRTRVTALLGLTGLVFAIGLVTAIAVGLVSADPSSLGDAVRSSPIGRQATVVSGPPFNHQLPIRTLSLSSNALPANVTETGGENALATPAGIFAVSENGAHWSLLFIRGGSRSEVVSEASDKIWVSMDGTRAAYMDDSARMRLISLPAATSILNTQPMPNFKIVGLSPHGDEIALATEVVGGKSQMKIVDAQGNTRDVPVIPGLVWHAQLLSDGSWVIDGPNSLLERLGEAGDISPYLANLGQVWQTFVSPDGSHLALFLHDTGQWVVADIEGNVLFDLPPRTGFGAWSPDGQKLAVTIGDGSAYIVVDEQNKSFYSSAGSYSIRIYALSGAHGADVIHVGPNDPPLDPQFQWSTDGNSLVFSHNREGSLVSTN